jgi:YHS domain-containing protein
MQTRVNLPGQTQQFTATVSHTLPRFDGASRSWRVRLELDNPGLVFRPEMFVDVEFQVPLPAAVSVPTGAVIDTGRRKIVYAVVGEGLFEPREVQTGWRTGDRVEIVRGLQPGEKIAVSGTFLLDSESRMRLAAAGLMTDQPATAPSAAPQPPEAQPPEPQPDAAQPGPTPAVATQPVARPDTTVRPDAVPAQPAAASEPHPEPVVSEAAVVPPVPPAQAAAQARDQAAVVKDPVCGMEVDPQQARAAGLTLEVAGVTHFFCSEACKQQFQQEPSGATGAPANAHAHDLPPDHGKGAHD